MSARVMIIIIIEIIMTLMIMHSRTDNVRNNASKIMMTSTAQENMYQSGASGAISFTRPEAVLVIS